MEKSYPIFCDERNVGTANVRMAGLYMQISCMCRFSDQKIYKLYAQCAGRNFPLGIPIPNNGVFMLEKRIPAKCLQEADIRFIALCNNSASDENAYCVFQDKPFDQLADINESSYLQQNADRVQIMIPSNQQ